jgi:hypothetical protein
MAHFSDASMSGSAMSHAEFDNCLGIYYQNVRGLRTKQLEFYDVCSTKFVCPITIYFLTDTPFTGLTGHVYTRLAVVVF